jgi:hypothetical protein
VEPHIDHSGERALPTTDELVPAKGRTSGRLLKLTRQE